MEGTDDGIIDTGLTFGATRSIPQLPQLNATAAAGVGLMLWGHGFAEEDTLGAGRISARVPLNAGLSYDVRVGGATFAPFATIIPAYSRERDYLDDVRVASDGGWKVGRAFGVTARFRETVLSISGKDQERGMPNVSHSARACPGSLGT